MKKVLSSLVIITLLGACGSNDKKEIETPKEIVADTTTNYNNSALTDTGTTVQTPAVPAETKKVTTTHKSTTAVTKPSKVTKPAPVTQSTSATTTPTPSTTSSTTTTTQADPLPAPAEKKKGWNNATKDAVIGGGAGAIGGAIISKKKGKGAIIGGVVGAAGGYILGRKKDKKDTAR